MQVCVRFSTTDAGGNDLVRESKLSLIDLAGSERASATLNRGARLQEGANINKVGGVVVHFVVVGDGD